MSPNLGREPTSSVASATRPPRINKTKDEVLWWRGTEDGNTNTQIKSKKLGKTLDEEWCTATSGSWGRSGRKQVIAGRPRTKLIDGWYTRHTNRSTQTYGNWLQEYMENLESWTCPRTDSPKKKIRRWIPVCSHFVLPGTLIDSRWLDNATCKSEIVDYLQASWVWRLAMLRRSSSFYKDTCIFPCAILDIFLIRNWQKWLFR